jgi:23S rRNA (uracil1939-C5)-methyltransferase
MNTHLSTYIESLDHEGRGVAHQADGKVVFIEGALPFEHVSYHIIKDKKSYAIGKLDSILSESFIRTSPKCRHFNICGGCSIQHVQLSAQIAIKQRILEDALLHIAKIKPEIILPPLGGIGWNYRHRGRLSVRWVEKKKSVVIGFHEKKSRFVLNMHACDILPAHVSSLIIPLGHMINSLSIKENIPQIEFAVGQHVTVFALRILETPNAKDEDIIRSFFDEYQSHQYPIQCWLQSKGPTTCKPFYPENMPNLSYSLPNFGIDMPYHPTEFTQVNPLMNQALVSHAIALLKPSKGERIADFFCGIGNFTLPIATHDVKVLGIEGSATLIERAKQNAKHNGLEKNTNYEECNLFEITEEHLTSWGKMDRWLIDPPRDGALQLVQALTLENMPKRIVYVSCNPSTLARDTSILVHKGYTLKAAGIANMFPHTNHVESIAWFEQENRLQ